MRSHTQQKIIPSAGEYHVLSTPEKKIFLMISGLVNSLLRPVHRFF